jgi:hypothetical protein
MLSKMTQSDKSTYDSTQSSTYEPRKTNEHIRYALHTYSWEYLTQVDIGHYKQ